MKISLLPSTDPLQYACEALVVGVYEDELLESPLIRAIDERLGGVLALLSDRREFSGKAGKTTTLYTLGRMPAERILLAGVGKREGLSEDRLRIAAGAAVQAATEHRLQRVASVLHLTGESAGLSTRPVFEGMFLGNYSFNRYQKKNREEQRLVQVDILCSETSSTRDSMVLHHAEVVCEATLFARDLVSQPANVATPSFLAEEAQELADACGVRCTVLEREDMERLGMDALLAVAKGSQQAPKFIMLEHRPNPDQAPVVIIGKGVTFDSGGISLKPREGMEKMKNDMAGAAAVMAVIKAIATLSLPVNVVALIPTVENLPGGNAYKPGDLVTSMSGQTIEIVNTDAEGRLILCDALHYAQQYKPAAIVDVATLTGACVVALGTVVTGMMGKDDALKSAIKAAGEATGDRVWELPLWEEFGEPMKSDIADMKNAGGPNGGAISAGWFLQQYVGDVPWVHLDIAGTAWEEKGKPWVPKGATGVGVRLLVEYLESLA